MLTLRFARRQASRRTLSPLESPTLFMPNTPMTTLEKRVAELKETPVNEAQVCILTLCTTSHSHNLVFRSRKKAHLQFPMQT